MNLLLHNIRLCPCDKAHANGSLELGGMPACWQACIKACSSGSESSSGLAAVRVNPIARAARWVASWAVPGLGMFNESYYIFSVGNIKPIWTEEYPSCWKEKQGCSEPFLHALNYSQVAGLISGMVTVGMFIDRIGRKWGSVTTAGIMFVAGALLTAAAGPSPRATFAFLIGAQALFGFGCGGEFPVAAASASERAESEAHLRGLRGRTTVLVFSMQAWGNILNLAVLLFFLAVFRQTSAPYNPTLLSLTWRLQYGLGLLPIMYMLYHRIFRLQESAMWKEQRRLRQQASVDRKAGEHAAGGKAQSKRSRDWQKLALLLRHYWHRLAGAALGWFAWDFYYYGNKLFQSEFISIIYPGASLVQQLEFNLLNSCVALWGYYLAAFTIDLPWMGRRRMQVMGFAWLLILFLACGLAFAPLTGSAAGLRGFQTLYFVSSFWAQFGPNATTFLVASELFPTEMRGVAHGFSAAVGKLGALSADIILGVVDDRMKFYLSAAAGGMGVLVTLLWVPELCTLDLAEGDLRWAALCRDDMEGYTGEAVNPANLSLWERMAGVGARYTADTLVLVMCV
ncbi:hypothetical protein WJX81_004005 [Elliptochloris bilobata]|uniref:Major facilitator superfamily (MFS) profile domain-containing protein n=1 Tax=Elliptochloris bilobata TaxID=381761 RepID=A0AAW1RZL6_9CHLO